MTTTDFTQERRDHVARDIVPWRPTARYTQCGRPAATVDSIITADELHARIHTHGQQRTAFTVCMTCWSTTDRHPATWHTNPAAVLVRELTRIRGYSTLDTPPTDPDGIRANNELHAIAAILAAHQDEYDDYLAAADSAIDLASRRRQRTGHQR